MTRKISQYIFENPKKCLLLSRSNFCTQQKCDVGWLKPVAKAAFWWGTADITCILYVSRMIFPQNLIPNITLAVVGFPESPATPSNVFSVWDRSPRAKATLHFLSCQNVSRMYFWPPQKFPETFPSLLWSLAVTAPGCGPGLWITAVEPEKKRKKNMFYG